MDETVTLSLDLHAFAERMDEVVREKARMLGKPVLPWTSLQMEEE
jgi:hypothetical protein